MHRYEKILKVITIVAYQFLSNIDSKLWQEFVLTQISETDITKS